MTRPYQQRVYELVRQIPRGQVASYGMIASLLPGVTARMVGYALAASIGEDNLPWQRVMNSQGKPSIPDGVARQRAALEAEGIVFTPAGKVSFRKYRWDGPDVLWLEDHGIAIEDFLTIKAGWP